MDVERRWKQRPEMRASRMGKARGRGVERGGRGVGMDPDERAARTRQGGCGAKGRGRGKQVESRRKLIESGAAMNGGLVKRARLRIEPGGGEERSRSHEEGRGSRG